MIAEGDISHDKSDTGIERDLQLLYARIIKVMVHWARIVEASEHKALD